MIYRICRVGVLALALSACSGSDTPPIPDGASADLGADIASPDVTRPDTRSPDAGVADVAVQDLSFPDLSAPDTLAPDTLAPDTLAPDTLAPDTLAPDTLAADMLAPDIWPDLGPDLGLPDGPVACVDPSTCGGYACDVTSGSCLKSCTLGQPHCSFGYTCNGAGVCVSVKPCTGPADCAPFACNASRGECYVICSSDNECATGHTCLAGGCVKNTPCSKDADCGPYTCDKSIGACLISCADIKDCNPGYNCTANRCAICPGDKDCDGDPDTTDCAPTDPLVHHGQTAFFTTPSSKGDYDYDCDGKETMEHTANNTCAIWGCTYVDCMCKGVAGWLSGPPTACGQSATWVNCHNKVSKAAPECRALPGFAKAAACR